MDKAEIFFRVIRNSYYVVPISKAIEKLGLGKETKGTEYKYIVQQQWRMRWWKRKLGYISLLRRGPKLNVIHVIKEGRVTRPRRKNRP